LSGNKKRGRGRPNLTWEESVKRDLKDWCITKELAWDRREWKLAIHVPESWSSVPSFYCLLSSFFSAHFSFFWLSVLLSFLLFWFDFFIALCFLLLFHFCFVPFFFAYVVSSLAYPNLLGNKMFGCCCCCYKEHICCDIVSKYQLYLIRKKRNINYILFFLLVYTIHIRIVTNVIPELSPHKPLRKLV
jgi:hypothetical protein